MKTVFMGTPAIAVPSLRLLAERTDVQCVLAQPDRPAGRGRKLRPAPVKAAAEELELPTWTPTSLRNRADDAHLQDLDLIVVMAYGMLLRRDILALPRGDSINLHASLLPRWRGASPLQAAIRAGDTETGVGVMRMVEALDAGPVYCERRLPLPPDATLPWLHDQIAELAALALGDFLDAWPDIEARPQDDAAATWCHKLTTADGRLDFNQAAAALDAQIRAYTPVPGCWTTVAGERLRISAARPVDTDLPPGQVLVDDRRLLVGCGEGALVIEELQPPGKRRMRAAAFLNGHEVPARLGS